jgi:hypothetical protein
LPDLILRKSLFRFEQAFSFSTTIVGRVLSENNLLKKKLME